MSNGWISLHRKILDNPIICKDTDYFSIWCYLLLNATHKEQRKEFNGKTITLEKGQLITGRKVIANKFNISDSKVQRVLKRLEIEQQIEQQTSSKNRLISIVNWSEYQDGEQRIEQQVNNKRTTSEQQVNTNNNVNKDNKVNNEIIKDIVEYLNLKANKKYSHKTGKTITCINARLNDNYLLEDFQKVIDIKCNEWLGKEHEKYLRPETLFGTKFESYINQREVSSGNNKGNDRQDEEEPKRDWNNFGREVPKV